MRIETIRGAKQAWSDFQFLIFKPDRLYKQNWVDHCQKVNRLTRKTALDNFFDPDPGGVNDPDNND